MEGRRAEQKQSERSSRRFAAYSIGAVAGAVATAVLLAVIVLGRDSSANVGPTLGSEEEQQTAFAFFAEFHATVIVTPATAGENTIDVILATHDGSGVPNVSDVTVTATLPAAGVELRAYPARPVANEPGAYRVNVTLPEAGDWELEISATAADSGRTSEVAVVPIGAR